MRRILLVLILAGLTVMASANDVFAQFPGYFGGWGYSPGISINVGRGGYYAPYGYYGGPGYRPLYRGFGFGFGPTYYNAMPGYYAEPAFQQPRTPVRQSNYPAPVSAQQPANVTVLVPAADARLWFENRATTQQGMERLFESPPLEPNHDFTYTIKVSWMENGQVVTRERMVNVRAGQSITVNFRKTTGVMD